MSDLLRSERASLGASYEDGAPTVTPPNLGARHRVWLAKLLAARACELTCASGQRRWCCTTSSELSDALAGEARCAQHWCLVATCSCRQCRGAYALRALSSRCRVELFAAHGAIPSRVHGKRGQALNAPCASAQPLPKKIAIRRFFRATSCLARVEPTLSAISPIGAEQTLPARSSLAVSAEHRRIRCRH